MHKQSSHWRWLAALLAGVLLWYLSGFTAAVATLPFGGSLQAIKGPSLAVFAFVFVLLATGGTAIVLRIIDVKLPDLGLRPDHWKSDLLIGGVGGVLMPLIQFTVIIPNTGGAARSDVIESRAFIGNSFSGLIAAIILGWLVGGFAEELFYRGFLITILRNIFGNRGWSVMLAALLSTLYFAKGHAYQGWIGMLDTGIAALIWAGLYLWRGQLAPGIIDHGLNDMLLLIGLYLWY